ncbi:MAG: hypothetical protein P8011_02965 [Acidihalobacter sp.]
MNDRLLSDSELTALVRLLHWLHQHPETGFEVGKAAAPVTGIDGYS